MSYTFSNSRTVLSEILPITPLLYDALEVGTQKAREYFKKDEEVEPYLAADIVRFEAKKYLQDHGQDVDDYMIQEIALNGLYLKYQKYHIRILKSQGGDLPPPGHSISRQRYYRQEFLPFPYEEEGYPDETKLIIIWKTNKKYEVSGEIRLLCPKNGGVSKSSVEYYWNVPVPDPIRSIKKTIDSPENSAYKDLEFEKIDKKKKQNKK